MNNLRLILTIDNKGRQVIVGGAGSGKSTLARILATHTQFLYLNETEEPCTAAEHIQKASVWIGEENPGIIVDVANPKEYVTDFDTTDIPIIYTKQLNRNARKVMDELVHFDKDLKEEK